MLRHGMPFHYSSLAEKQPEIGQFCYFALKAGPPSEGFDYGTELGYYLGNYTWVTLYANTFDVIGVHYKGMFDEYGWPANMAADPIKGIADNPENVFWFPIPEIGDSLWKPFKPGSYPNYPDQCFFVLDIPDYGLLVTEGVYDDSGEGDNRLSLERYEVAKRDDGSYYYQNIEEHKIVSWMLSACEYYGSDPFR